VSGGAYRDEAAGLAARLEGLRDDVHRSETRFPPPAWVYLPATAATELAALRAAVPREPPTTIELSLQLEAALEAYRTRLEIAIAAAREIEPYVGVAPDGAPELVPRHGFGALARMALDLGKAASKLGLSGWPARIQEGFVAFDAVVSRRFPDARFETPAPFARRATVRAGGAPICLLLEVPPFRGPGDGMEMRAATHIALAVPRVDLTPETVGGVDVEVGDPQFDGIFDVSARPEHAPQVLVAEVRSALVRLAWHDVPTVAIGEGRAEIAWTCEPTRDAIDDASRALAALRQLQIEARLLAW